LSTSDVVHLVRVFDRLAQRGNAVVLIEHHAGLLATCDVLVELGPTGGDAGGRIVAIGTPRELAADAASITGPYLFADESARALPPSTTRKRPLRKKVVG
jgi:excinuclease ABC subunit A